MEKRGKRKNKAWSSGGYMVCRARTIISQRQLVSFFLLITMTGILHIKLCLNPCPVLVNVAMTLLRKYIAASKTGV
jgi:hypothetical protein